MSYVSVDSDEGGDDPDGLDHADRMALEARAISIIREYEPVLQIMPQGNEGFDLLEADMNGEPERWIEVKAMTCSLKDRPVGLSKVQFEFARRHGEQFWLYIVEYAHESQSRIVKIQNPAGRAGTFTFDHGWIEVADLKEPLKRVG